MYSIFLFAGYVMSFVAGLWIVVLPWQKGVLRGIGCLLFPLLQLIYIALTGKKPSSRFSSCLLGSPQCYLLLSSITAVSSDCLVRHAEKHSSLLKPNNANKTCTFELLYFSTVAVIKPQIAVLTAYVLAAESSSPSSGSSPAPAAYRRPKVSNCTA